MLQVNTFIVGDLAVNCYVITDKATGECAVIDPGEITSQVADYLEEIGYDKIKYILLTHGHYDHIGGVIELLEKTENKAEVAIGEADVSLLNDSFKNLSELFTSKPMKGIPYHIALHTGEVLNLGESTITVLNTPGHTKGSVCFICGKEIFSGDTLFFESAGRTDFPTSNSKAMNTSLGILYALKGDYKVYPGHNQTTTLEHERKNNPYMNGNIFFYGNLY